jgi:hypothetical protein
MCEVLFFFQGGVTVAEYDAMPANRLRTVKRWMRDVKAERARQAKRGSRG